MKLSEKGEDMNNLFYYIEARKLFVSPKEREAASPAMTATCNSLILNLINAKITELQQLPEEEIDG